MPVMCQKRFLQLLPRGVSCEEGRRHDQMAVAQDSHREVADCIALGACRVGHAECVAERTSCEGGCRRRKNFAPRKWVGAHPPAFDATSAISLCHGLPIFQAPSNRNARISGVRCELHIKSRSTTWCVEALHRCLDALMFGEHWFSCRPQFTAVDGLAMKEPLRCPRK